MHWHSLPSPCRDTQEPPWSFFIPLGPVNWQISFRVPLPSSPASNTTGSEKPGWRGLALCASPPSLRVRKWWHVDITQLTPAFPLSETLLHLLTGPSPPLPPVASQAPGSTAGGLPCTSCQSSDPAWHWRDTCYEQDTGLSGGTSLSGCDTLGHPQSQGKAGA